MLATTMIYQPSENALPMEVVVYSIEHTHDAEGQVITSFATAWNSKLKQWLVAPLWEFKPIESKVLKEETK